MRLSWHLPRGLASRSSRRSIDGTSPWSGRSTYERLSFSPEHDLRSDDRYPERVPQALAAEHHPGFELSRLAVDDVRLEPPLLQRLRDRGALVGEGADHVNVLHAP